LEVIEDNEPLPRWLPPYLHGLFATTPQEGWSAGVGPTDDPGHTGSNPTLVNNVETLAHVPLILDRGADWYRTVGTRETPGPLICTVGGDVAHDGFGEIEPGTSLRQVIGRLGGGIAEARAIKAVLSGVPNPVLTEDDLDTPVSHEGFAAAGSGLGSAGFIVFDDTRSMLSVARMVSRFLYVESCGQCRACKYGTGEITRHLDRLATTSSGDSSSIEIIGQRLRDVTNQNRCFLGEQEQRVISSLLRKFPQDFSPELSAASLETLPIPKIVDLRDGFATYDGSQGRKQPDWTHAPS
jgi:NADH-quinone oxidoreductase subunit F